jgi:hypothetical protein
VEVIPQAAALLPIFAKRDKQSFLITHILLTKNCQLRLWFKVLQYQQIINQETAFAAVLLQDLCHNSLQFILGLLFDGCI